ncbi:geranylgeranylglycerol-phosphate geranylgeranyltransferase [Winogradskyella aurantiaca]|uniref:geranylgeranylglycerol-phosphate geranylgeranyltransferase n=1 Tax=Winogradskyella aurantiaca TaxID=2219558 RepID=UPI000E1D2FD8|nr:geranylgeranylglycerol-phosphate geranylgeranyltransferase [Winogradskyella aurantiaca]
MAFLNLIRWKNLLIIALVQLLIKYTLLEPFIEITGLSTTLKPIGFITLVLATLCIAAAGYIINDIYDTTADSINRPEKLIVGISISEKVATRWFIALNVIGVGLGYLISSQIGKSDFFAIFIIISGMLYLYSAYLKQYLFIGNIVISAFVALSILLVGIYDLLPGLNGANREMQLTFFDIILDYAFFAFLINLLREMVKDIEDTKGDKAAGYRTIATQFGVTISKYICLGLSLLNTALIIAYLIEYFYKNNALVIYFLILIIAPLLFISVRLLQAKETIHYSRISSLLKVIMLTGVCSMIVFNLTQS